MLITVAPRLAKNSPVSPKINPGGAPVLGEAKTPVRIDPSTPPTPCTAHTSRASSQSMRSLNSTAP